jgi:hypothetical protein
MCTHASMIQWPDVREAVRLRNPALAKAFDRIDATTEARPPLLLLRYEYGSVIVEQGMILPPDKQCPDCAAALFQLASVIGATGAAEIANAVGLGSPAPNAFAGATTGTARHAITGRRAMVPLCFGLVLERHAEVFMTFKDKKDVRETTRSAPLNLISPGEVFGAFEVTDRVLGEPVAPAPWSVSAGARTIHILQPMHNVDVRNAVNSIAGETVFNAIDDADVVAAVVSLEKVSWQTHVLFVPDAWFMGTAAGPAQLNLVQTAWRQSRPIRDQALIEQQGHAPIVDPRSVDREYFFATLRQIAAIASGERPGFLPFRMADPLGPFEDFQRITIAKNLNRRSTYFPEVLQPHMLQHSGEFAYYSLKCPSLTRCAPRVSNVKDMMEQLGETGRLRVFAEVWPELDHERTVAIFRQKLEGRSKSIPAWKPEMKRILEDDFSVPLEYRNNEPPFRMQFNGAFLEACIRVVRA